MLRLAGSLAVRGRLARLGDVCSIPLREPAFEIIEVTTDLLHALLMQLGIPSPEPAVDS
jgi:hypothetical protein